MFKMSAGRRIVLLAVLAINGAAGPAQARAANIIESYATVNDDATLTVRNRRIRLHGVYVPATSRTCLTRLHPVRCAPRAVHALDFRIRGFVACQPIARFRDRSISARCHSDGVDLGAYLIDRGWAVAAPDAPFEYTVLERVARHQHRGIWGFQADLIQPTE